MSESLELLAIKESLERIEKLLKEMILLKRLPPSLPPSLPDRGGR